MKLSERYNRISFITTAIVMLITGMIYYFTVSTILTNQIDKSLSVEEKEIFDHVHLNHTLPQVFESYDLQIYFKPIGNKSVERKFVDTRYHKRRHHKMESGRALISSVFVNGVNYQIQIIESKVETEYLIKLIFLITVGAFLLLVSTLFVINRLVIRKLWKPFFQVLQQLKRFNLTDQERIEDCKSGTDEFDDLNTAVAAMASRVRKDYQELKTFTENASHELMTPLAVLNSKLDTLAQEEGLGQRQSELVSDAYETMAKLTRLNRSMLLLTKIENNLIRDQQTINIKDSVEDSLAQFSELFQNKNLRVTVNLQDVTLKASPTLWDILLNNLIGNAIRHNRPSGEVMVFLDAFRLSFHNTGVDASLDAEKIFQRFNKSPESEGSGLGLTLSRQICRNYGMNLEYKHDGCHHIFSVVFNNEF